MACHWLSVAGRSIAAVAAVCALHARAANLSSVDPAAHGTTSASGPNERGHVPSSVQTNPAIRTTNIDSPAHYKSTQFPIRSDTETSSGAEDVARRLTAVGERGESDKREIIDHSNEAGLAQQDCKSGNCGSSSSSSSSKCGGESRHGGSYVELLTADSCIASKSMDVCLPRTNYLNSNKRPEAHADGESSTMDGLNLASPPVAGIASDTGQTTPRQQQVLLQTEHAVNDSESGSPRGNLPILGNHEWSVASDIEVPFKAEEHDAWAAYDIVVDADPVPSWEVVCQANLSFYTFRYDRRKGRRQLGVLPSEVAHLMPEAFSTFTLPVVLSDGSRSRVEGVPNVDWTYLFAHTVAVTQELVRRTNALQTKMDVLRAESQNVSLKLVRLMEEQGKEWQPAARLRDIASVSELKRDIVKNKAAFERTVGRERRRSLELRHVQTLATAELEANTTTRLAEEKLLLATQTLQEKDRNKETLETMEESLRRSTEVALLLLDIQAENQTARLSVNRRLSEGLTAVRETAAAEREGEVADVARIRAKGEEARRQTQAVVDEMFALVGAGVLSIVSNPSKLAKSMAALLGLAFVGLLVGNAVTLTARALRRRATKPQLVRETDLPGSLPAAAVDWIKRRVRVLLPLGSDRSWCDSVASDALQGIVLPPEVEHRLRVLAISIRSSYCRGAPLPHVLIHGATGSGKTLLAKRLITMCGLKTVIVAGGDVGPLGSSASSELSSLMRWAGGGGNGSGVGAEGLGRKNRGTGVALVMDEAEAALGDRRKKGMSETARSALNAVLLHTGELQPGFMMVLTTSRPQDLDEAVLDRVDEVIHLPQPTLAERARLARQYFSTYLHHDAPTDFLASPGHHKTHNVQSKNRNNVFVTCEGRETGTTSPSTTMTPPPEMGGDTKEFPPVKGTKEYVAMQNKTATSPVSRCDEQDKMDGNGDRNASPTPVIATENTSKKQSATVSKRRKFVGRFLSNLLLAGKRQEPNTEGRECSLDSARSHARDAVQLANSEEDEGDVERVSLKGRVAASGGRTNRSGDCGGRAVVCLSKDFKDKDAGLMAMLAIRSEGFYGRDMARFFSALQAAVYGSEDCELTEELWTNTERQKLREFFNKTSMTTVHTSSNTGSSVSPITPASILKGERGGTFSDRKDSEEQSEEQQRTVEMSGNAPSHRDCGPLATSGNEQNEHQQPSASTTTINNATTNLATPCSLRRSASGGVSVRPHETDRLRARRAAAAVAADSVIFQAETTGRGDPSSPCDPEVTRPERFADCPVVGRNGLF